jgi:hypothetical protein
LGPDVGKEILPPELFYGTGDATLLMSRRYQYVGTADLNNPAVFNTIRTLVTTEADTLAFLGSVATFTVDTSGLLWIADSHSKHVACARGGDVLSAGRITFGIEDRKVTVAKVTNMSTGYCPEPESWPAVAAALDKAGIWPPDKFTQAFLFRRCLSCGQTNTVKENDFTCAVCGAELNQEWNFTYGAKAEHSKAEQ